MVILEDVRQRRLFMLGECATVQPCHDRLEFGFAARTSANPLSPPTLDAISRIIHHISDTIT